MSESIAVIGGAGGTYARLEDLSRAVKLMNAAANHLVAIGKATRVASRTVVEIDVPAEHLHALGYAADRIAWIDQGQGGATRVALEIEDLAWSLRQTVDLLEQAERVSESIWTKAKRLWDKTSSVASAAVWVPLKAVGAGSGAIAHEVEDWTPEWLPVHWVASGGGWLADTVNPDWTPNLAPLVYGDDLQALLAVGDDAYQNVTAIPQLVLSRFDLCVPDDLVAAISGELAVLALALDEILGDLRGLLVVPVDSRDIAPPMGVADLLGRLDRLSPNGADGAGRIAISRIEHQEGEPAWIVEIPGTQDGIPDGGSNVIDITSNFLLMSLGVSDLTVAVERAMETAGVSGDEEVLIVGHSQGGIAAMSLVSQPSFSEKYNVTAVLTAGAPVGRTEPPPGTSILCLEHPSDTVPALDATHNPDQPNWTTVRRDLASSDNEADRRADDNIIKRHELDAYRRTAAYVDTSTDPSIRRWLKDTEAFWEDDGRTTSTRTVYEAIRGTDGIVVASTAP